MSDATGTDHRRLTLTRRPPPAAWWSRRRSTEAAGAEALITTWSASRWSRPARHFDRQQAFARQPIRTGFMAMDRCALNHRPAAHASLSFSRPAEVQALSSKAGFATDLVQRRIPLQSYRVSHRWLTVWRIFDLPSRHARPRGLHQPIEAHQRLLRCRRTINSPRAVHRQRAVRLGMKSVDRRPSRSSFSTTLPCMCGGT